MLRRVQGKCNKCLTGKETLELDKSSPVCPYLHCYTGKHCPFFVKLSKKKRKFVLSK